MIKSQNALKLVFPLLKITERNILIGAKSVTGGTRHLRMKRGEKRVGGPPKASRQSLITINDKGEKRPNNQPESRDGKLNQDDDEQLALLVIHWLRRQIIISLDCAEISSLLLKAVLIKKYMRLFSLKRCYRSHYIFAIPHLSLSA